MPFQIASRRFFLSPGPLGVNYESFVKILYEKTYCKNKNKYYNRAYDSAIHLQLKEGDKTFEVTGINQL
jgi:hypothetical protein